MGRRRRGGDCPLRLSGFLVAVCLLILAPDLSMLGYLAGPRVGAIAYNALHILIVRCCWRLPDMACHSLTCGGLIWIAHIAIDRALGYGLKLSTGFRTPISAASAATAISP